MSNEYHIVSFYDDKFFNCMFGGHTRHEADELRDRLDDGTFPGKVYKVMTDKELDEFLDKLQESINAQ